MLFIVIVLGYIFPVPAKSGPGNGNVQGADMKIVHSPENARNATINQGTKI
jgi:hypothetical protein